MVRKPWLFTQCSNVGITLLTTIVTVHDGHPPVLPTACASAADHQL